MTAKSVRECVRVTEGKKIAPNMGQKNWENFTNYMNELFARGYKHGDVFSSIKSIIEEKGIFDDIYKELGKDPKWKKFEKILAGIHMLNAEGAKVKFNDHVVGKKTCRRRQVDVSLQFHHGYYVYLVIIECKDLNKKVSIGYVEAFITKMEDVGAQKGIMVSSKGFQQGAITTAEAYNIELFTLKEEMGDWTKKFREDVIKIPFPINIKFDHTTIDKPPDIAKQLISTQEILFYKDEKIPPITLAQIIADVSSWAYDKKIALPCIVDLKFKKEFLLHLPGINDQIPIRGMDIKLEKFQFRSSHRIDIPPKHLKYIYSDAIKNQKHEIPAEKIPIGVDTVLEPRKFYTNRLGMKYRCIKIEGNDVTMMLLDSHQHGKVISAVFVQDAKYACHYVPITDPKEVERLEDIYQSFKRWKKDKK